MSDLPPGFPAPPPPPPTGPPPVYGGPGFAAPPPGYAPAQQPVYSSGWQAGQAPPQYATAAVAAGGAGTLIYQFGGAAAWSIGCGLISMVVPFVFNIYFPILPIVGALNGFRAIQRGRVIGGAVGIGVNVLGGLVSLVASGILFGGG